MTDYASVLQSLGYKLTDRGNYWQSNALFRGGDNRTALRIYKDNGVWCDFVESGKNYPFELLVKKTTGKKDVSEYLNGIHKITRIERKLLKEEKTFSNDVLRKLLPDYDYFLKRGVTKEVQQIYQCGLASSGKLYQRMVFPIRREDKRIHGFSGRKVIQDNNRPNWLHWGQSKDWFYPFFTVPDVERKIKEEKAVYLVESIGDSMKMFQNGFENNLVVFGKNIGPKLVSKLAAIDGDIIFAFNDDSNKEGGQKDQGQKGALSSILKLIDVVDLRRIWFVKPTKNDFGEMDWQDFKQFKDGVSFSEKYHLEWRENMVRFGETIQLPKNLESKLKKLL